MGWDVDKPGDSDIVSQYPANERAQRASVRDVFDEEHHAEGASQGYHRAVTLTDLAGDLTVPAGSVGIWNDGGQLKTRVGTGSVGPVGIPTGGIIMWSGSIANIPDGWALCDGSNGTPDLRDRFVVGAGSTYAVGATGGAATVALTTAQMPAHTHTGTTNTTGAHTHNYTAAGWGGGSGNFSCCASWGNMTQATTSSGNHSHTFTTAATGSGEAHENRPPYYALAYIMKL